MLNGDYKPKNALMYNFVCPIPMNDGVFWPRMANVVPGSYLCYSNKKKLDENWIDRCESPDQEEQLLRILNHQLVENDETYCGDHVNDKYAGIWTWANPTDAYLEQNTFNDHLFYPIRDRILQKWQERRYAAGWHPQIRMTSGVVDRAKLFDVVNEKVKEATKGRKDRRKESWRSRK